MAKPKNELLCARQDVSYVCAKDHDFTVTFAATATPPAEWECRCGKPASLRSGQATGAHQDDEHARRMEQLRGRRTPAELEQLLSGRLAQVRAGAR